MYIRTVENGYNEISLYDTSSVTTDNLWYQLIPQLAITLYYLVKSVRTTFIYNDTKSFMMF